MPSPKLVDRIAALAMLSVSAAIPLAALGFSGPIGASGEAAAKLMLQDGAERRFYTTGPLGTRTYRVDVSSAGKTLETVQVLGEDSFGKIRQGMPATEVFARLGPPYRKLRFERTRTTAWDYHFRDAWGYDADFSVMVDDAGIVAGTFTARIGE